MGRNRAVWGEDAEVFCPERWLVDEEDIAKQDVTTSSNATPSTPPLKGVSPFGKFKMENQFKFNSFNANPRLCLVSFPPFPSFSHPMPLKSCFLWFPIHISPLNNSANALFFPFLIRYKKTK
jgi:hypothetical protein